MHTSLPSGRDDGSDRTSSARRKVLGPTNGRPNTVAKTIKFLGVIIGMILMFRGWWMYDRRRVSHNGVWISDLQVYVGLALTGIGGALLVACL